MREAIVKKTKIIKEFLDKVNKSESLLVVEYSKLKVSELENLRGILREKDSELKIYKNNLVSLALKDTKYKSLQKYLVGPNAIVFGYKDQLAPAKLSAKFAKNNSNLIIKAGIYDKNVLGTKEILEIALLPSKEELIATFASLLKQPLIKFALAIKEIVNIKE